MNIISMVLGPIAAAVEGAVNKAAPAPKPKGVSRQEGSTPLQVNPSTTVLAVVDEGTTSRSSTINSLGRRGGQTGRINKGTPGSGRTLGGVLNKMMRNEGPEAHDRKRQAMGPAGSIVTEARPAPKGLALNVLAASYTTARNQTQAVNGTVQLMDKSPQRRILSPASSPALARGTGFTLQ